MSWKSLKKSYLQQELAVAERQVSELKLHERDLELQAQEYQAQEAAEEQEVMKVNEVVLRGEEALAETEEAMTVDSVDTSEFTEWLQARKDEVEAISRACTPRRPMLLLEVWISKGEKWRLLGEQWLPYAQARPQATWTLPLERLAASRPSDAKTQGESTVSTERWYLHLSGARMARAEFPCGSFDATNYSMGFEDFVFQLLQIVSTGHEGNERYEGQRVKVEVWLWGGTMFLNPAPECTWYKAFESTGVSLSGKDLALSAKFADRFTLRLKLHPLYSQVSRHDPSEAVGQVPREVCEEGSFQNTGRPPVSFVAAGGMAVVFIDYSEPEFDDFSAKLQMRLCVCPCISGQVLQAVTLQAVPNDSVGEKHLTWTWSANSTRLRSFATERLLTVELRLPREATKTGSRIGSEPSKQTKAFNASNAFNSKSSTPSVYAPQLWLKAVVLQAGEAVDHIDEELILPVTIVQFLRPLDCSEQQLQEYWEGARHFMYILDIPHELELLKWSGIRQVETTISCGVFRRQPDVQPPPGRCDSGAAAILMGALLPCTSSTCCFIAFTGGGGQKLTVKIFCTNEAFAKMILQYLTIQLDNIQNQKIRHLNSFESPVADQTYH